MRFYETLSEDGIAGTPILKLSEDRSGEALTPPRLSISC